LETSLLLVFLQETTIKIEKNKVNNNIVFFIPQLKVEINHLLDEDNMLYKQYTTAIIN